MKKLSILLPLIIMTFMLPAQEMQKDTLSKKEIRKMKREAEAQNQFMDTYKLLVDRSFVLQADYIENQRLYQPKVKSMINFVMVDSTDFAIQVGSDIHNGRNGVGGTTLKGKITGYNLTRDEKTKSFSLVIKVNTPFGYGNLFFDISALGDASASVSGMGSGLLIFKGRIVRLKDSFVFLGNSY